jgi:hypothetical protein
MSNLVQISTAANQRLKRAEDRLATLRELEALTLRIIPTVGGDAPEGASEGPKPRDPVRAFQRLSRSLRLTQALAARVETEIAALKRPFLRVARRDLNLACDPFTS